jgi:PTH1 family peptidyl-tRNA hydrolase
VIDCIVGLGNPGRKYDGTRHNIGYRVVDLLAQRAKARWRRRCFPPYEIALLSGARTLALCKPLTYMNHSGRAVRALCRSRGVEPEECLVMYDDVHLPLGRMRARRDGSAGGHNGVKSIIAVLGTEDFPRLRLGIGPEAGDDRITHVLGRFRADEQECVNAVVEAAADAALRLLNEDWLAAVQDVNAWTAGAAR